MAKIPKKAHLGTLRKFMKNMNLDRKTLERIVTRGPATDPSIDKGTRSHEAKVYKAWNKIFTPANMQTLSKDTAPENVKLAKLYNKLKGVTSQSPQTEQQQEATKEVTESLLKGEAYKEKQLSGGQGQGDILSRAKDVLDLANLKKPGKDAPKAEKTAYNRRKTLIGGTKGLADVVTQAYKRGAQPEERFGQRSDSKMLNTYDQFINAIRPGRTGTQKAVSAISPYASRAGGAAGSAIGGPIGGVVGSLAGSGLGYLGSQYGQTKADLSPVGELLSGTQPGYFQGGKRGLADIIAGTDKRSTAQRAYDALTGDIGADEPIDVWGRLARATGRTPKPTSRVGRLRQSVGGKVRGVGKFMSAPGRADQLRLALMGMSGLYNIGEKTGINRRVGQGIRSLGQRLGIFGPSLPTDRYRSNRGEDIAAAAAPGQYGAPLLQQQASQFFGRPISAQEATQGYGAQVNRALAPQIAKQNIKASQLQGKRNALNQKRSALEADEQVASVINEMKDQQQQQEFARKVQDLGLRGQEATETARLGATGRRLGAAELASGQQTQYQVPLEMQRGSQVPDVFNTVAAAARPITGAYTGKNLYDYMNQPAVVNPTVGQPGSFGQAVTDTTKYNFDVT